MKQKRKFRKIRMRKKKGMKFSLEMLLYVLGALIAFSAIVMLLMWADSNQGNQLVDAPLPAPAYGPDAVCGNGVIEMGENCGNCFLDARCNFEEECINGFCAGKRTSVLPYTLLLIILSVISIAILSYKLMQRTKGNKGAEAQRLAPLKGYIGRAIRAGQKVPEIKINLLRAGWPKKDVEKVVRSFGKVSY